MNLTRFAKLLNYTQDRAERDEYRYFCATNPQRKFFFDESPTKALIAGNQIGKRPSGRIVLSAIVSEYTPNTK